MSGIATVPLACVRISPANVLLPSRLTDQTGTNQKN
jgi:hypothetical protein